MIRENSAEAHSLPYIKQTTSGSRTCDVGAQSPRSVTALGDGVVRGSEGGDTRMPVAGSC